MAIDIDGFLDQWEAEQAQPEPEPEPEAEPAEDTKKYRAYVGPKFPLTTEQALEKEVGKLSAALAAPGLTREAEVEIRERLAFLTARRSDVAASLPFKGTETSELEAQLEASEEERDELRLALDQALAPGGNPSAKARRLQGEYDAFLQSRAKMTAEVQGRMIREATTIGMAARAGKKAGQELTAEDTRTITDAPSDWRRAKLTEELAGSFAGRLADRAKAIETDLWRDAEVAVGRDLLHTGTSHSAHDVQRERLAEKAVEAARAKYAPTS